MVNLLPLPGALSTEICPPCAWTMWRTRESPSPLPMVLDLVAVRVQGVANQFGDVGLAEVVFFASCLDAGEIENVVDQSGEPLALLANDAVVLLVLLLAAEATHLQRLRVQPDQRQGG